MFIVFSRDFGPFHNHLEFIFTFIIQKITYSLLFHFMYYVFSLLCFFLPKRKHIKTTNFDFSSAISLSFHLLYSSPFNLPTFFPHSMFFYPFFPFIDCFLFIIFFRISIIHRQHVDRKSLVASPRCCSFFLFLRALSFSSLCMDRIPVHLGEL